MCSANAFWFESWKFSLAGNDLGNIAPSSQAERGLRAGGTPPPPPAHTGLNHPICSQQRELLQELDRGDERMDPDPLFFFFFGSGVSVFGFCCVFFFLFYSSFVSQERRK